MWPTMIRFCIKTIHCWKASNYNRPWIRYALGVHLSLPPLQSVLSYDLFTELLTLFLRHPVWSKYVYQGRSFTTFPLATNEEEFLSYGKYNLTYGTYHFGNENLLLVTKLILKLSRNITKGAGGSSITHSDQINNKTSSIFIATLQLFLKPINVRKGLSNSLTATRHILTMTFLFYFTVNLIWNDL